MILQDPKRIRQLEAQAAAALRELAAERSKPTRLTLEQAEEEIERLRLAARRRDESRDCRTCHGRGRYVGMSNNSEDCGACGGSGRA